MAGIAVAERWAPMRVCEDGHEDSPTCPTSRRPPQAKGWGVAILTSQFNSPIEGEEETTNVSSDGKTESHACDSSEGVDEFAQAVAEGEQDLSGQPSIETQYSASRRAMPHQRRATRGQHQRASQWMRGKSPRSLPQDLS